MSVPVSVRAEALGHRYGRRAALRDVAFEAGGPGVVAVTGANGSGKSTLLRIVAGVLRPSAGRLDVTVGARALAAHERRGAIGLASPELSFYEELSAGENLAFVAETRGIASADEAVAASLARVGLASRGHDRVAEFSSGMKQRLRLAFAMLHSPALLLLDEPGAHLDEEGREVVREVIARHAREGLVLVATNDPEEVALAGSRIELRGRGLGDTA